MSQRSNSEFKAANAIPEERILDAAYELLLSIGMQRMTMADIARRAEVSRATLYRRWGGVREVIRALTTREWSRLAGDISAPADGEGIRERLVGEVVRLARTLRTHPLVRKIIDLDPDFLLPYLLKRRGASTDQQLALLEAAIRVGQADGSVRDGDPALLARSVLLTAWSFTLTGPVFVDEPAGSGPELDRLDAELRILLDRYLAPAPPAPVPAPSSD